MGGEAEIQNAVKYYTTTWAVDYNMNDNPAGYRYVYDIDNHWRTWTVNPVYCSPA